VLVVHGFFDDSGKESHNQERFVSLAGYLSYPAALSAFIEEWQQLVLHHGLPGLHLRAIMRPDFLEKQGWDQAKRNAVLMEFAALIPKHKLVGVGVGIDAEHWRNLPKARRRAFGNAQEFAFQRIVWQIGNRLQGLSENDFISVCFDQDRDFSGARLNLFWHAKDRFKWARRFHEISFGDSRYIVPLQAADLLASETRKELIRRAEDKPSTERFKSLLALELGEAMRTRGEFWDRDLTEKRMRAVEAQFAAAQPTD
jgi:hypothetical protein